MQNPFVWYPIPFASISPYSRIYISLDHFWNSEAEGRINAKQFVNYLAQQLSDVYWNVAYHPYPYSPLDPKTWLDPVTYDENTEVISMKNISVLTDYMKQFPNPDGSQKRVILSEVGFQGTDEGNTGSSLCIQLLSGRIQPRH